MDDLISRQAAIDAIYEYEFPNWCDKDDVSTILNDLEPAQPEIIRCEECLHWQENILLGHRCNMLDWTSKNNDFCSLAKRREDG